MRLGKLKHGSRRRTGFGVALLGLAVAVAITATASARSTATIKVGLITKDVTNPFFVKIEEGATAQAKKLGAKLVYAAGKSSSDNAGERGHVEHRRRLGGSNRAVDNVFSHVCRGNTSVFRTLVQVP